MPHTEEGASKVKEITEPGGIPKKWSKWFYRIVIFLLLAFVLTVWFWPKESAPKKSGTGSSSSSTTTENTKKSKEPEPVKLTGKCLEWKNNPKIGTIEPGSASILRVSRGHKVMLILQKEKWTPALDVPDLWWSAPGPEKLKLSSGVVRTVPAGEFVSIRAEKVKKIQVPESNCLLIVSGDGDFLRAHMAEGDIE